MAEGNTKGRKTVVVLYSVVIDLYNVVIGLYKVAIDPQMEGLVLRKEAPAARSDRDHGQVTDEPTNGDEEARRGQRICNPFVANELQIDWAWP